MLPYVVAAIGNEILADSSGNSDNVQLEKLLKNLSLKSNIDVIYVYNNTNFLFTTAAGCPAVSLLLGVKLLQSNVVRLCPISGHSFGKKNSIPTKITIETILMGPN